MAEVEDWYASAAATPAQREAGLEFDAAEVVANEVAETLRSMG